MAANDEWPRGAVQFIGPVNTGAVPAINLTGGPGVSHVITDVFLRLWAASGSVAFAGNIAIFDVTRGAFFINPLDVVVIESPPTVAEVSFSGQIVCPEAHTMQIQMAAAVPASMAAFLRVGWYDI